MTTWPSSDYTPGQGFYYLDTRSPIWSIINVKFFVVPRPGLACILSVPYKLQGDAARGRMGLRGRRGRKGPEGTAFSSAWCCRVNAAFLSQLGSYQEAPPVDQ